jgi:hypothetical protein
MRPFSAVALLSLVAPTAALAGTPTDCDLAAARISSVVDTDGYTTKNELSTDGYEPVPLLTKSITTAADGCVVAQLSLHTLFALGFGDEYTAAEVTLDGVPMYGHTTACVSYGRNVPCLLMANNSDGATWIDAHSYHLVMPNVTAGPHTIEVRFAGVDADGNPTGAYVGGSVLTVQHQ